MLHKCELCNFENSRQSYYLKHLETEKHIKNKHLHEMLEEKKIIATSLDEIKENQVKNDKKLNKKLKQISNEVKEVKTIAEKTKIYSQRCLRFLNEQYKNNPPLPYPGDEYCLGEIFKHFNITEKDYKETTKLEEKIIYYYSKNKLAESLIQILLPILKKDDPTKQSVFNTDSTRNNFATKYEDEWKPDKAGLYLNKQIIKPFCNVIIEIITLYRDDFKQEVKNNEEKYKGDKIFDAYDELQRINTCLCGIKDSKLYDSIIYKLSSNLHYKTLINNDDKDEDEDEDEDEIVEDKDDKEEIKEIKKNNKVLIKKNVKSKNK